MKEKLKKTDVWFKLFLFAVFAFLYWLAIPYPEKSRQFPQLIALVSLSLIVLSLLMDFTTKNVASGEIADVGDTELKPVAPTDTSTRTKRFTLAWGIILVSTAVGVLGGFLFSAFLFFWGFAFFFGDRTHFKRNSAVALGITVAIYLLFQQMMGVPLLAGVLW